MLDGLSGLGGNALAKVLRRTIVSSLIVGAAAVLIALLLSQPWAALGLAFGLTIAVLNLRFLDAGVAKLNTSGETNNKVLRRALGTKSVTRLGVITVICIGLLLLNGALGIGAVAGLVIFQLLFVVNVGRVIISQGIQ
ncbi:MAG TPA: ATP synthase subunit I [Acidimicrobiales bacterium]